MRARKEIHHKIMRNADIDRQGDTVGRLLYELLSVVYWISLHETPFLLADAEYYVLYRQIFIIPYSERIGELVLREAVFVALESLFQYVERVESSQLKTAYIVFYDSKEIPFPLGLFDEIWLPVIVSNFVA